MYKNKSTHHQYKQKEDSHDNHFDHSNQNERFRSDRTKPCNLMNDATELKSREKDNQSPINHQDITNRKWKMMLLSDT